MIAHSRLIFFVLIIHNLKNVLSSSLLPSLFHWLFFFFLSIARSLFFFSYTHDKDIQAHTFSTPFPRLPRKYPLLRTGMVLLSYTLQEEYTFVVVRFGMVVADVASYFRRADKDISTTVSHLLSLCLT